MQCKSYHKNSEELQCHSSGEEVSMYGSRALIIEDSLLTTTSAEDRNALAAQLYILEATPLVIVRILKRRGSLLLAAKLLLLSRLTHKTLAHRPDAPPVVDSLRDRLASLRIKLLRAIDKRFADPERDVTKLVDDMCAFSLATSSTPSDVLQHFLKIRLRAMQWHLEQHDGVQEHALKAMKLLLTTLRNAQSIFPKRLADSLVRLKDLPLIRQSDVQAVSELSLGIHSRWLADELQKYTPWPRHDELQKSDADKILKSWAKTAQKSFVAGLKLSVEKVLSFHEVLHVRQHLFETWPWAGSRLPGLHSADVIDELREVLNARLTSIIQAGVAELKQVYLLTQEAIASTASLASPKSLWHSDHLELDTGDGGAGFKSAILRSYNGMDASESQPLQSFETWIGSVKQIQSDLKHMRDAHWNDDLGEDDDDLDSKQTLLSDDDPRTLTEYLGEALSAESRSMVADFGRLVQSATTPSKDDVPTSAVALLRILREIAKRAAAQDTLLADVTIPLTTSTTIIHPLHGTVTTFISTRAEAALAKSLNKWTNAPFTVGTSLWEGKPPLPAQPSVMTFKLLKLIVKDMAEIGADLWSEAAAKELKVALTSMIAKSIADSVAELVRCSKKQEQVNGDASQEDTTKGNAEASGEKMDDAVDEAKKEQDVRRAKLVQLTFDLQYLSAALAVSKTPHKTGTGKTTGLQEVIDEITSRAALSAVEVARLQKSGADYWKRTYLLFGLLAG
jgi:hypothetical protein